MSPFDGLFARPDPLTDTVADRWFTEIADRLLCGTELSIGDLPHRLTEVEFYYCGDGHADPFGHKELAQLDSRRWYFHRTGGQYRGGSFKGVDIAFGDGKAFAGALIRGLETPDGRLVDGPSLVVDRILAICGAGSVAELDGAIAGRTIDDSTSPLHLRWLPIAPRETLRCPRVGLTLKRAKAASGHEAFLMRPYRWLSEPRRIAKGKPHMVLGLYAVGKTSAEIAAIVGSPRRSIDAWIARTVEGETSGEDYARYFGADLRTADLCRLFGTSRRVQPTSQTTRKPIPESRPEAP